MPESPSLQPDASELILTPDPRFICETYIFDPVAEEELLGRLFAVGETEDRGGVGSELLDLTIQALQREYYREPSRGILASFESALHQANLVLHDTAEQGLRDWMGYFHVAIGVLAHDNFHLSTSGNATVLLCRKSHLTHISTDLSHSPITNPLRTFAQVASGTITPRDVLFLGTSQTLAIFRPEELTRLSIDHSASAISTRLRQLYTDKRASAPLGMLTLSILPEHIVQPRREADTFIGLPGRAVRNSVTTTLTPRKPLVINRSFLKTILVFLARMVAEIWQRLRTHLWPFLLKGSRHSGRLVARVSRSTGQSVQSLTQKQLQKWQQPRAAASTTTAAASQDGGSRLSFLPPRLPPFKSLASLPRRLGQGIWHTLTTLPRSSKIFAGLTVVMAITLVISVFLLRDKRAEEAQITRASEILHDARNSKNAAEDALIYNNREQALSLLTAATTKTNEVAATGLYTPEVTELRGELSSITDRLQKVVRATTESTRIVGDFKELLGSNAPRLLSFINNTLYTFHPETNSALSLSLEGKVDQATQQTEGIGFFTAATDHVADKAIILATDAPGIALFDAKTNALASQDISFSQPKADVASLAIYGSRLYVLDSAAQNIFGYTKTLRGYTGGTPWITNAAFPKDSIKSIGVDGNVYTLHADGTIRKLLKGEPVEFGVEPVEPSLQGATKLIKSEGIKNVYVADPTRKRIVIYTDQGKLVRQVFIETAQQMSDFAVSGDEKTIYVLDGTRVLAVTLAE